MAQGLDYRLDRGTGVLDPTARVRVIMDNRLPPDEVDRRLGLVQTAIYLYEAGSGAASVLAEAAASPGLPPAPEMSPQVADGRRVSVQVPGVADADVGLALVLGRALRVTGSGEVTPGFVTALRADPADLADRLRWGVDTLIPVGQERVLWEGSVPLATDSLYVNYIAVRAVHVPSVAEPGSVAEPQEMPEGGILSLSPTAVPANAPALPSPRGTILMRAESGHLQPLSLRRGVLNIVKVRAFRDEIGSSVAGIDVSSAPLLPASR